MAEAGTRGSVLRRATIFVRDLDAAVAFYSEAFGFERYYARDMDLSVIGDVPFGDEGRGGSMRFAIVRGLDPLLQVPPRGAVRGRAPQPDGAGTTGSVGLIPVGIECGSIRGFPGSQKP